MCSPVKYPMAALYADKSTPMGEHGIKCTDYDRQLWNTQGDHISTIVFDRLCRTLGAGAVMI